MAKSLSDNEIRAALDKYLDEHYGNEPVLSIVSTKEKNELKFNLVEDTITLHCDQKGNITEKRRKRRLPKSEVEGQLSLSDIVMSPKSDMGIEEEQDYPEDIDILPEEDELPKPKKKHDRFRDGMKVLNIFTGDIYTVVDAYDNMLRVRPEGELSTIMLTAADLKEYKEGENE